MACATSDDGAAHELRRRVGAELGADGWLEKAVFDGGRDPIWYCSLVRFAGGIDAPTALVDWVDAHRGLAFRTAVFGSVSLCTWTFEGGAMAPRIVESVDVDVTP